MLRAPWTLLESIFPPPKRRVTIRGALESPCCVCRAAPPGSSYVSAVMQLSVLWKVQMLLAERIS